MTLQTFMRSQLWQSLEAKAAAESRDTVELLSEIVADYLEVTGFLETSDRISEQLKHSGYSEDDAVELVKQYRYEKRNRAA